jgi:hypothetical protein
MLPTELLLTLSGSPVKGKAILTLEPGSSRKRDSWRASWFDGDALAEALLIRHGGFFTLQAPGLGGMVELTARREGPLVLQGTAGDIRVMIREE